MPATSATIGSALRAAQEELEAAEISGARVEASLLLGHVLGHSRAQLVASLGDPLSREDQRRFSELTGRRARREPLQYLTGRAAFLDFELEVTPGVLIPRPETEGVVERALEIWDTRNGEWAVDVGTGSGAIAIGLARGKPDGRVLAVDRSASVLHVAAANRDRLGVRGRVALVQGNFLRALDLAPDDIGVIVSNPPYVAYGDDVGAEVGGHEPHEALFAGPTGLEAFQRIIPEAAGLLRRGRGLVLELGYGQEQGVRRLFADTEGWEEAQVDEDYRGVPRVMSARRA